MTKIFYDTEFIDNGSTIDLISIGMIAENGEEFYRINEGLSLFKLSRQPWHMENTVPTLPIATLPGGKLEWDDSHADFTLIMPKAEVKADVYDFILRHTPIGGQVELWAWYGAYDHVALAQLWGPMNELPRIVPMYTNDLKQEMSRVEKKLNTNRLHFDMPTFRTIGSGKSHNALDDARLLKLRYEWLSKITDNME